jgi:hypothetical protein
VRLAVAGPEAGLAPGGGVGVVLDHHREAGALLDRGPQRLVAPGQVGREQDGGAGGVDEPGRAQAGRLDLVLGGQLTDAVGDDVLGLGRIVGRGVASQPCQDAAVVVHHAGGDLGPADVHADGQPHGLASFVVEWVLILRPRPEG